MSMQAVREELERKLKAADWLLDIHAITEDERDKLYREAYNEARKQLGLPPMPDDWRPPVPPKVIVLQRVDDLLVPRRRWWRWL